MKILKPVRIIGIDPGSYNTGYGIIEQEGSRLKHIFSGTIKAEKTGDLPQRLKVIFQNLSELLSEYQPDTASIEKVFFSKNPHSALILGHARGVIILALSLQGIEPYEYAPNEVKSSVVGAGKATKDQVQSMVQILLNRKVKMGLDESDALAIAICHAHTNKFFSALNKKK